MRSDPTNTSSTGHGTAVSINVAGNTNNSLGMSSIGWDLSLNFYRMNYNEVIAASYAGAKVINLSWTSGCTFNQYLQEAINEVVVTELLPHSRTKGNKRLSG